MSYQQEVMSDDRAIELMQELAVDGVKLIITPVKDTFIYLNQKYVFTPLQAKNKVLVERFIN